MVRPDQIQVGALQIRLVEVERRHKVLPEVEQEDCRLLDPWVRILAALVVVASTVVGVDIPLVLMVVVSLEGLVVHRLMDRLGFRWDLAVGIAVAAVVVRSPFAVAVAVAVDILRMGQSGSVAEGPSYCEEPSAE